MSAPLMTGNTRDGVKVASYIVKCEMQQQLPLLLCIMVGLLSVSPGCLLCVGWSGVI